ncbi:hypothetical protein [Photorhabdus laumondii]|uniref:hypothetical protein n=1 Tax=Photorhabdus laumondii TaxID=2218628 RepID=UPI00138A4B57|nr:hypothetical protein [Photorhabdus laumondii]
MRYPPDTFPEIPTATRGENRSVLRKRPVISPCSSSPAHARYRFLIFTWRLTP